MSRTVLLTGATGFVGRQVLKALMAENTDITLVLRDGHERPEGVSKVVRSPDLFAEDAAWWSRTCEGVDTIIHTAWYAVPGKYLHAPENIQCLAGTLAMAEGAMRVGVRRFVGIGTCFEYQLARRVLATDTPLGPETPYAACKTAAFLALSQYLPGAGVSFAWCRLFYLHGEGEDGRRLVPYLRQQLAAGEPADLTSGNQIRDFLDVGEAARRIVTASLGDIQGPINICSGVPVTVRQLAERIADEYGRRDLLRFGTRPDNAVDPDCVLGVPTELA